MAILTKKEILEAKDMALKEIEVPEWGGSVLIGPMTLGDRLKFEEKHADEKGAFKDLRDYDFIKDLICMSVKDENGEPLFNDEDFDFLNKKSSKAIQRLLYPALTASYMTKEANELLKKKRENQ